MKSFDSRTYSINDFVDWEKQGQLELNPTFQRRPVWSDKAKSFLMDTIIRGKPIPKFFIRQKLNVTTRTSIREVVDGQQRLRSILSFVKDGFVISRAQNPEFGGTRFSQLPEDVQAQVLSYEISVDLLINLPDSEVLDIFSRLNSYAVILNEQEKLNAEHFGPFKILADNIGRKYNDYWVKNTVLTPRQILRMAEVNLVADLLISLLEGIRGKKRVRGYYKQYERTFTVDVTDLEARFDRVVATISKIFPEGLSGSEFSRPFLFYSLFNAVAHCLFGLPGFAQPRINIETESAIEIARNGLERVEELFAVEDTGELAIEEREFLQNSRRATTDQSVREGRARFLLSLMA
ncbi:hypothetical protein AM571_CH03306 [Rhizobium etli 8C-3]|uniref:GmrSD restriction endonucleases N-terminal domain-containing protein n=1 Tax=Rhizobium etli 8C-3 TaxID=538025 RepID=A0A1L5P7J7_RHIET|nr:DUF262 domain-containing protein [Rhizobium etli]APO76100.1 hypothetical protein AM571_CH03306 [Rhizobium etli 8C-3]